MGRIFLYRFLILFLLPKLHHSATQAVINHFHVILWTLKWFWEVWSDFWEVWSDFGKFEVILGNLPNLWNVLASSIGKSLTRASKAPTRLSLHEILVTPQNFVGFCRHWYLLQILFLQPLQCTTMTINGESGLKSTSVGRTCNPYPATCTRHLKIGNIFLEIFFRKYFLSPQNWKCFLEIFFVTGN